MIAAFNFKAAVIREVISENPSLHQLAEDHVWLRLLSKVNLVEVELPWKECPAPAAPAPAAGFAREQAPSTCQPALRERELRILLSWVEIRQ